MRKRAMLTREQAESVRQIRAIGRELREQYDLSQPLSDRLAELMQKIEQSERQGPRRVMLRLFRGVSRPDLPASAITSAHSSGTARQSRVYALWGFESTGARTTLLPRRRR
jgi:hypothetical protein